MATVPNLNGVPISDVTPLSDPHNPSVRELIAGYPSSNNVIDNGRMTIDQRYEGAETALTAVGVTKYGCDRWGVQFETYKYVSGDPTQFTSYTPITDQFSTQRITDANGDCWVRVKTLNAYPVSPFDGGCVITQIIESANMGEFGWGTSQGKLACISFTVRSSVAGFRVFGLQNDRTVLGGPRITPSRSILFPVNIPKPNIPYKFAFVVPSDSVGPWKIGQGDIGAYFQLTVNPTGGVVYPQAKQTCVWEDGNKIDMINITQQALGTLAGATIDIRDASMAIGFDVGAIRPVLIEEEITRCRRHYRKSYEYGVVPGTATTNGATTVSHSTPYSTVEFGTPMSRLDFVRLYSPRLGGTANTIYDSISNSNVAATVAGFGAAPSGINATQFNVSQTAGYVASSTDYYQYHYTAESGF